jgi:transcriptional regulator with XRE-family HTH domain
MRPLIYAVAVKDTVERRVGKQLGLLRRHRGWSLRDLAERSGLALTTVHQVETARTSAGLGTLRALADALGVPLAALLEEPGRPAPVVRLAAAERPGLALSGGRLERLASGLPSQRLRGLVLTLEPRRASGAEPLSHPGQELVVGLEGTCRYEVAGRRYRIGVGDSLLFDSQLPHRASNAGTRRARLLLALYAPEQEPAWLEGHGTADRPAASATAGRAS